MQHNRGTMRVARAVFEHPVLAADPFDRRSAWLWLIAEAAWQPRQVHFAGKHVDLTRGEYVAATRFLAARWQWHHSKVRRFLKRLEREQMITRRATPGWKSDAGVTVIGIVNYDRWQNSAARHTSDTPSDTPTDTPHETRSGDVVSDTPHETRSGDVVSLFSFRTVRPDRPRNTRQNGTRHKDNINKKKEYISLNEWPSDAFDRWYAIYPQKKARTDAKKAFTKVQQSGAISFPDLLTAAESYAASVKDKDKRYIPYPASWLNKGHYLDEPEPTALADEAKIAKPERHASTFSETDWRERLNLYRQGSTWPESYWGPKPGAEGCLVPAHLINGDPERRDHG